MVDDTALERQTELPIWSPIVWAPRQRRVAIGGMFLLIGAFALVACAYLLWGTRRLALGAFVPLGMTLDSLGIMLLCYVFWYPYRHGRHLRSDYEQLWVGAYGMFGVGGTLALIFLPFQIVGALVLLSGSESWDLFTALAYSLPVGICLLVSFGLTMFIQQHRLRPLLAPSVTGALDGAPVSRIHIVLRWIVMVLAQSGWLIIGGAWVITTNVTESASAASTPFMGRQIPVSVQLPIIVFASAAAFMLVAVLVEVIDRPHPPSPTHI